MAFFDKVLGRDEKEVKLRKEINSLLIRKESILGSIGSEIARLEREKSAILLNAGTAAYEAWKKETAEVKLEEYWAKIQEIERLIAEQEAKKVEMERRYDEEIQLLENSLNVPPVSESADDKCPKCGAGISAEDVFCQNCGTKVK